MQTGIDIRFLYQIADRLGIHYTDHLANRTDERQVDLWSGSDPPF